MREIKYKEDALDIIWSVLRDEYIEAANKPEIFELLGLSTAEFISKKGDNYILSVKNHSGAFHYIPKNKEPFIIGSNGIPYTNHDGVGILDEERIFTNSHGSVRVKIEILVNEDTDPIITETFWSPFEKIIRKAHKTRKECDVCGNTEYTGFHTILKDSVATFSLNPNDYLFICNKCKPETTEERKEGRRLWKT